MNYIIIGTKSVEKDLTLTYLIYVYTVVVTYIRL